MREHGYTNGYTRAYTPVMAKRTARRDYGAGSVYRLCDTKRYGCPPAEKITGGDGETRKQRPDHDDRCRAPWRGVLEIGGPEHTGRYKANGEPIYRRPRKTVTGKTKSEVVAKLKKIDPETAVTNVPTVEQWLTKWLDEIIVYKTSPKGLRNYRWAAHKHLIPHLGKRKVNELTPAHILKLHQTLRKKKKERGTGALSSTSVQRVHAALSAALNDAAPFGYLPARGNPCEQLDRPAAAKKQLGELSAEQAARLLKRVEDHPLGSRWAFALLTGCRQGECLGLRWSQLTLDPALGDADVAWQLQRIGYRHGCLDDQRRPTCGRKYGGDCSQPELDIDRDDYECEQLDGGLCLVRPKGDKRKLIPLIPSLVSWLQHRQKQQGDAGPHDLVWTRDGGRPLDPRQDWQAWIDLLDQCGLPRVNLHSARHTCVSLLYALNVQEAVIQQIAGHSVVATTRDYRLEDLGPARAALGQLGEVLEIRELPGR